MPNQILKNEEELPSTRDLLEPDTLRVTVFPSGTPAFDACLVATGWPEGSFVMANAWQYSFQRSDIESWPIATIGFRVFIVGHSPANIPASTDIFELNTGNIAVRVASGTGVGGSDWIFEELSPGTLVRLSNSPNVGCMIVVNEVGSTYYTDNGGTGKLGIDNSSLFLNFFLEPPPYILTQSYEFQFPPSFDSILSDRLSFVDPCRKVYFEWSEDGLVWNRLPTSYTEAEALSGIEDGIPYPPEAVFIRASWVRGGNDDQQVFSSDVTI